MTASRSARRVAVLSDVHGNAVALEAVLAELDDDRPDLVVFGGDLTWGPLPEETLRLVESLSRPALFVRGNAERALLEPQEEPTERARWLRERHAPAALAFFATFAEQLTVDVAGLGPVRFCHGSPRSDDELVTPETPAERIRALAAGVEERTIVSAHTHLQFDRRVPGVRSVNPGSIGMPYEGRPGAFWALLGPDVELRRTDYDVGAATDLYRASGDPLAEQMIEILEQPPTREEVTAHAESLEFSG
jgi:predicted phosphodiesterase